MSLTPRENFKRALHNDNPEWLPLTSEELMFCPRIIPDNIARGWVREANEYTGPVGGKDMFGIEWIYVDSVGGSMEDPDKPHILSDISEWRDKVVFPDMDSWNWKGSAVENKDFLNTDRLIVSWVFTGMFERLISFLGFEDSLVALIDEDQQEDTMALFQALADHYKGLIARMKKYYNIDAVYFHDDWGAQKAPFFSADTCSKVIAPYIKQIVDFCHENDLIFYFHCCGKNEMLVPVMIECGIDCWCGQPINDKEYLIKNYGNQIFIGIHAPFGPAKPVPDDEDKITAAIDTFLEPYTEIIKETPFFIADLRPNSTVKKILCSKTAAMLR